MKMIIAAIGLTCFSALASAHDTFVNGYVRSNGTYVQPHFRSAPNGTTLDNYSTRGNVNPYTGQEGTKNPYEISNPRPSGYGLPGY